MDKIFQDFIYFRTYSRWLENEGRREFWPESVERYKNFFLSKVPKSKRKEFISACEAKQNCDIMGSMRALWTAGKALDREGLCAYNCAYTPIDNIKALAELVYLLMNGTGVGYSIERQYVNQLPEVPELRENEEVITFADSKLGWAEGYYKYLKRLFNGEIPKYDLSKIRPKGSPLKTFGGRASGKLPLEQLLKFTVRVLKNAQGRKLNSLEINDICCYIASIVVVAGTRRSACLSLSNPSDDRMRHAKDGQFWNTHPYRTLANNSIAYTEKPDSDVFLSEFLSLIRSGSGERGIFNRSACQQSARQSEYRKSNYDFGVNPCFTGNMRLLTSSGYKTFEELEGARTVMVINKDGNQSIGNVWCSGIKDVYEISLSTSDLPIKCTQDHVFMLQDGSECYAIDLKNKYLAEFEKTADGTQVISVEYVGREKVYDFSEPQTNWGVVEGMIVHNCGERILRPKQLCNLSEVIIKSKDDKDTLCRKVRQATILGCVQATVTNFNFVSRDWKRNTEEERLIGVSLTGLRDHYVLNKTSKEAKLWLTEMYQVCMETAKEWSSVLEINMPACLTAVKPSGTCSALCGTASGLHPRFAQYYIRRVRVASSDPISQLMIEQNVPYTPEVGQTEESTDTWVFDFPLKSPETSVLQEDVSALDQLEYWLMLKKYWTSGNPSCTIYVKDDEWPEVAAWVYKHFDYIAGITFLPRSDSVYEKMPFEEISELEYKEKVKEFPEVDFSKLSEYENSDRTEGAKEYACTAGQCEVT